MTSLRASVAWHLYDLTGNEALLGWLGLTQFIPSVLASLAGGLVADRTNRATVVRTIQWFTLLASPALIILSDKFDAATWPFFVVMAMVSALASFESPSRSSLLVSLVSRDELPRAVTLAATMQALAFALGPALAGALIASYGMKTAYLAHFVLVLCSMISLRLIRFQLPPLGPPTPIFRAMSEGFSYALSNRIVFGVMLLDFVAVVLGGASALLPVYARDILNVGAEGYGLLTSSAELGALAMSLLLMFIPPIRRQGRALLWSVAFFGVSTILFGLSTWFPLSLFAYALVGAFDQVSVVMRHTTVQMNVSDEMRGRVSSINTIFILASNQLGAFESGLLSAATSPTFAVTFGGVGAILATLIIARGIPQLRNFEISK